MILGHNQHKGEVDGSVDLSIEMRELVDLLDCKLFLPNQQFQAMLGEGSQRFIFNFAPPLRRLSVRP